jgi:hypothetical protein
MTYRRYCGGFKDFSSFSSVNLNIKTNHLMDIKTNHPMDIKTNHLMNIKTNHLMDIKTNHLMDIKTNHLMDIKTNVHQVVSFNVQLNTGKRTEIFKSPTIPSIGHGLKYLLMLFN